MGVPAAFSRSGWAKINGKNRACPKTVNGRFFGGKIAVFWQTGPDSGIFSTRTEMSGFAGIFSRDPIRKKGKGARFGLILPYLWILLPENEDLHPGTGTTVPSRPGSPCPVFWLQQGRYHKEHR